MDPILPAGVHGAVNANSLGNPRLWRRAIFADFLLDSNKRHADRLTVVPVTEVTLFIQDNGGSPQLT